METASTTKDSDKTPSPLGRLWGGLAGFHALAGSSVKGGRELVCFLTWIFRDFFLSNLSISRLNPPFQGGSNDIQHAILLGKIQMSFQTPFIALETGLFRCLSCNFCCKNKVHCAASISVIIDLVSCSFSQSSKLYGVLEASEHSLYFESI